MSRKIIPLGLKLVIILMVLMSLVVLLKGLVESIGGAITGSILFLVSLILVYIVIQRESFARISIKFYFIFLILATLYNIIFLNTPISFIVILQMVTYIVIVFYMNSKEVKELFTSPEKKIRYKMEEIRREEY